MYCTSIQAHCVAKLAEQARSVSQTPHTYTPHPLEERQLVILTGANSQTQRPVATIEPGSYDHETSTDLLYYCMDIRAWNNFRLS